MRITNSPHSVVSKTLFVFLLILSVFYPLDTGYTDQQSESTDPRELIIKADELYKQGLQLSGNDAEKAFGRAASLYELASKTAGVENGYLYYNTGNCYLQINKIGLAIYYYRKAMQYIPRYDGLKANLRTATEKRLDKTPKTNMVSVWRTLFFWHFLTGVRTRSIIFISTFLLGWIFLFLRLRFQYGFMKTFSVILFIFSAFFFISTAISAYELQFSNRGVLVTDIFEAKTGPGYSYDNAFEQPLHDGAEFSLLERDSGWMKVELDTGDKCWIRDDPSIARLIRE